MLSFLLALELLEFVVFFSLNGFDSFLIEKLELLDFSNLFLLDKFEFSKFCFDCLEETDLGFDELLETDESLFECVPFLSLI